MNLLAENSPLADLCEKVESGGRITDGDAMRLFECRDLNALAALANLVREKKVGDRASFIVNRYINYSNYCILSCQFCSFARKKRDDDGFELTTDEIVAKAKEALTLGVTELHIVGGLHPSLPLSYYIDMLKTLKSLDAKLHLKCFTAVEILHLGRLTKKSPEEILGELRDAGLDSLTGGGAEIFSSEIREQIARIPKPQKLEVSPKDQFETQAMYQQRFAEARKKDQAAQQRYNQEVSRIEGTLTEEVKARSEGYKEALVLLNRDLVLDETQVVLNLGPYDAESELFPDARLGLKGQSTVDDYEWELYIPIAQAKQFKDSVISGTAKIRVNVNINANAQTAVIEKAEITDLIQNLTVSFAQPKLATIRVSSNPGGAMVFLDGTRQSHLGIPANQRSTQKPWPYCRSHHHCEYSGKTRY